MYQYIKLSASMFVNDELGSLMDYLHMLHVLLICTNI